MEKLSCDRYDLYVEYMLMNACIQGCDNSGVTTDQRIQNCAEAITSWQCSEKINPKEANARARSCQL